MFTAIRNQKFSIRKVRLKDHLGNVRAVVDVNRNIYSSSSYYPFGLAMQKMGGSYRYGYQGEFADDETNETGWNSFELRMYDPVVGRWMAPDPYSLITIYWNGEQSD